MTSLSLQPSEGQRGRKTESDTVKLASTIECSAKVPMVRFCSGTVRSYQRSVSSEYDVVCVHTAGRARSSNPPPGHWHTQSLRVKGLVSLSRHLFGGEVV